MTGALAGEWTKLTTTRASWWTALVALLGIGGIGTIIAFTAKQGTQPLYLTGGANLGLLVAMVLAALAATSDHSTGTHRLALMAEANRVRLFAAKAAVMTVVCGALGALGAGIVTLAAYGSPRVLDDWTSADVRGITGQIVIWALGGLLAVAVGTLVRRTALAISIILVVPVVVESMIRLIPKVGNDIAEWTPFNNASMFTNPEMFAGLPSHGPLPALAVIAAYAVGLAVLATVAEARRDA